MLALVWAIIAWMVGRGNDANTHLPSPASSTLQVSPLARQAQELPPELTQPVNDFAAVVDSASAREMEALIRSLQRATGDVVVVATVDTISPYPDIDKYAVKMFENHGRGIGERGRDNGLLIVVAVKDRMVRVEVGYKLEAFITDEFAGETSRDVMAPFFRRGEYGKGLLAGSERIIGRIAEGRNVKLPGVRPVERRRAPQPASGGCGYHKVDLCAIQHVRESPRCVVAPA